MRNVFLTCLILWLFAQARAQAGVLSDVDIPYQKYVLPNGLTLIVHEDHKAPIVAVDVWYHVGSKDELPGRTGFAHLFEHLMFTNTENHRDEFFRSLITVGATKMNGNTWLDRTTYFENVPVSALGAARQQRDCGRGREILLGHPDVRAARYLFERVRRYGGRPQRE
jgi:Insulinase (Peptidase family M16)